MVDEKPDDDVEVEETEDEGAEQQEWTPPSKEDWDKAQRRLKKLELDSKRNATKAKEAEERANAKPDQSPEQMERAAEAKARERVKPRLIKAEARAAFAAADLKPERFERAFAMLKLSDIDVDDDDQVHGLEDAIADLKDDVPELFTRRRTASIDGGDRSGDGNRKPKSSADTLAALLTGK